MAVKAVCIMNGIVGRDAVDHTKFYLGVNYAVLNEIEASGTAYFYGLDPGVPKAALISAIEAQAKALLQGEGVTFGPTDTVLVLNGPAAS